MIAAKSSIWVRPLAWRSCLYPWQPHWLARTADKETNPQWDYPNMHRFALPCADYRVELHQDLQEPQRLGGCFFGLGFLVLPAA